MINNSFFFSSMLKSEEVVARFLSIMNSFRHTCTETGFRFQVSPKGPEKPYLADESQASIVVDK